MTEPERVEHHDLAPEETHPPVATAVQLLLLGSIATWVLQRTVLSPADVQTSLGFAPGTFTTRWWTIATYAFVHADGWQLLMNGYVLWLFGRRVEARWGAGPFVRFYFLCILGGWFVHLVAGAPTVTLSGSTAPVLGVLLAHARLWPDESVYLFGTVPTTSRRLVVIVGTLLVADGVLSADVALGWAYLAHLGGVAAAWATLRAAPSVALKRLRRGVNALPDDPDEPMPRAIPRSAPRARPAEQATIDDVVAQANAAPVTRPASRTMRAEVRQGMETLDRLLDKISEQGIESLTADEKRWLEEASKKLQRGDG